MYVYTIILFIFAFAHTDAYDRGELGSTFRHWAQPRKGSRIHVRGFCGFIAAEILHYVSLARLII